MPRKNILPLKGKPLIAWTVEAAGKAKSLTDWLVSTDDEEIARAARKHGAPVPFIRPKQLSGDRDRNTGVLKHALGFMEEKRGRRYDIVLLLQPTCPVRDPAHIDEAAKRLWASELPTLASVTGPVRKRDPNVKAIRGGALVPFDPLESNTNWDAAWIYNASIYGVKRGHLLSEGSFVSRKSVPLAMDRFHSVDIDEEIDMKIAELYMEYLGVWA